MLNDITDRGPAWAGACGGGGAATGAGAGAGVWADERRTSATTASEATDRANERRDQRGMGMVGAATILPATAGAEEPPIPDLDRCDRPPRDAWESAGHGALTS